MAGESAREVARKQREKAERHQRVAELYERGADGESATAAALDQLRSQGWVVLHDVAWPGRQRANIDHVAIGPGGVFVIDSKNWSGSVAVTDGVLRQNGRSRETAVVGAAEASLAVTTVLGNVPSTGVLCFVRDEDLRGWARAVMVCSTRNVVEMLTSRPTVLHPEAVKRFAQRLEAALPPATDDGRPGLGRPVQSSAGSESPAPQRSGAEVGRGGSPSRMRRADRSDGKRLLLLLAGLVIFAFFRDPITAGITRAAETGAKHYLGSSQHAVGDSVTFAKTDARPELRVKVGEVQRVHARGSDPLLAKGDRLVAVRLTIENKGDVRWRSKTHFGVSLSAGGQVYTRDMRFPQVAAGELLPQTMKLQPGIQKTGLAVFVVPKTVEPSRVNVTVGPAYDERETWQITQD